jgi:hypothetical protein
MKNLKSRIIRILRLLSLFIGSFIVLMALIFAVIKGDGFPLSSEGGPISEWFPLLALGFFCIVFGLSGKDKEVAKKMVSVKLDITEIVPFQTSQGQKGVSSKRLLNP